MLSGGNNVDEATRLWSRDQLWAVKKCTLEAQQHNTDMLKGRKLKLIFHEQLQLVHEH